MHSILYLQPSSVFEKQYMTLRTDAKAVVMLRTILTAMGRESVISLQSTRTKARRQGSALRSCSCSEPGMHIFFDRS